MTKEDHDNLINALEKQRIEITNSKEAATKLLEDLGLLPYLDFFSKTPDLSPDTKE